MEKDETILEYVLECSDLKCHYSDKGKITIVELPQGGGHLQHYLIKNKCTVCGENLIRERAFTIMLEDLALQYTNLTSPRRIKQ